MARLVKLARTSGDEFYVNPDFIEFVSLVNGEVRVFPLAPSVYFAVQGTLEEVVAKLNGEPEATVYCSDDAGTASKRKAEAN